MRTLSRGFIEFDRFLWQSTMRYLLFEIFLLLLLLVGSGGGGKKPFKNVIICDSLTYNRVGKERETRKRTFVDLHLSARCVVDKIIRGERNKCVIRFVVNIIIIFLSFFFNWKHKCCCGVINLRAGNIRQLCNASRGIIILYIGLYMMLFLCCTPILHNCELTNEPNNLTKRAQLQSCNPQMKQAPSPRVSAARCISNSSFFMAAK